MGNSNSSEPSQTTLLKQIVPATIPCAPNGVTGSDCVSKFDNSTHWVNPISLNTPQPADHNDMQYEGQATLLSHPLAETILLPTFTCDVIQTDMQAGDLGASPAPPPKTADNEYVHLSDQSDNIHITQDVSTPQDNIDDKPHGTSMLCHLLNNLS